MLRDLSRNGGVQRLVHDLVTTPVPGVTFSVLAFHAAPGPTYADDLAAGGIPVHIVSRWSLGRIRRIARQHDIVHAHLFPALYIASLVHPRAFYTEHNTSNNRRKLRIAKWIEPWIYRRFKSVICITPEVRDSLTHFAPIDNTVVIYNGVKSVAPLQSPPPGEIRIAMVGSLLPKKDQTTIIEALRLVPNVSLHLAGTGPELERLKEQAQGLPVTFHGVVSDVPAFLATMHLYVQSSNYEGFGLAAIEAMACGLPTLCSDVPGLNNLASSRAHLFPRGDARALADLICRFMKEPDFASELRRIAATTWPLYSIEQTARAITAEYQASLERRPARA